METASLPHKIFKDTDYSQLLEASKYGLSTEQKSGKQTAFDRFMQKGFPTPKNEEWKYTGLGALTAAEFEHAPLVQIAEDELQKHLIDKNAINFVLINGILQQHDAFKSPVAQGLTLLPMAAAAQDASHAQWLDKYTGKSAKYAADGLNALNEALSAQGVYVHVKKGTIIETPIYIYHFSGSAGNSASAQVRHLTVVEENAQATVVEVFVPLGTGLNFVNTVTEGVSGKNAVLNHFKIQHDHAGAIHVGTTHFVQEGTSVINQGTFTFGGKTVRNNLNFELNAPHCESNLNGLYLLNGDSLVDNHTVVDNTEPGCLSNELYKGVFDEQSTGVFNGKIFVRQKAQKTNAFQSNKNILLSDNATINTKPQLEIWADDVKCSHGSTTGSIDREALFYLKSRGLGEKQAKALLLAAFAADVLSIVKNESLKTSLEQLIMQRLAQI